MKKESNTLRQPYVIHIDNPTNDKFENITIFFGNSFLNEKFDSIGNFKKNGLIMSSLKDVNLSSLLQYFYTKKTRIVLTTITSETQENNRNCIKYTYYGTNGHSFSKQLIFLNENFLSDSENLQPYVIDGSVALILNSIEPNSKLILRFYPKDMEECNDDLIIQNTVDKLINREV